MGDRREEIHRAVRVSHALQAPRDAWLYRGGELADPDGLLPEKGGKQVGGTLSMRSLKLASIDEVARPALRALLDESTRTGVPPPV